MFAFSAENILDEQRGESLVDHLDRLPSELSIVFETGESVLFPAEITAVLAVKPRHGEAQSRLYIPLQHLGEGRYQFGGTSDDLDSAYSWFREHFSDFDKGNIVIEHFDGLRGSLRHLNGRDVETKLRATYSEKDVTRLISRDYSHLTTEYFDAFPYGRGWQLAPEIYHRVPVEVLDAVRQDTFESFPLFAQQLINEYRANVDGATSRGVSEHAER